MKMTRIALIALGLALTSLAKAAPSTYNAVCYVVQVGDEVQQQPAIKNVSLRLNDSVEILKKGDLTYSVFYGPYLNQGNALEIKTFNSKTGRGSASVIFIDQDFPPRVDHTSEQGVVTCGL